MLSGLFQAFGSVFVFKFVGPGLLCGPSTRAKRGWTHGAAKVGRAFDLFQASRLLSDAVYARFSVSLWVCLWRLNWFSDSAGGTLTS